MKFLGVNTVEVNVYSDSGHSWAAVKRSVLSEIGILHKITEYSYQKGGTVYLEEDVDFPLFVTEMSRYHYFIMHKHIDHGDRSVIRSYSRFSF